MDVRNTYNMPGPIFVELAMAKKLDQEPRLKNVLIVKVLGFKLKNMGQMRFQWHVSLVMVRE